MQYTNNTSKKLSSNSSPSKICTVELLKKAHLSELGSPDFRSVMGNFIIKQHRMICYILKSFHKNDLTVQIPSKSSRI